MHGFVYTVEEVACATIEDDGEVAILQEVELIDDGVVVPSFKVLVPVADVFLHVPVVGEGAYVEATAGASYGTKHVFVADGIPHGAMSAHAEACDGALATVGDGRQVCVDILYQLLGDEGLVAIFGYYGAIPIPTTKSPVGAYEDDTVALGSARSCSEFVL